MSRQHGPLADRPINPKVGLEIPHESADLHVTGAALYTDDLVGPDQGRAARLAAAVAARARPRHRDAASNRPTRCPAWCGCSPPRTCPASTTPASSTTSRCSRPRSCSTATPSAGCSARPRRPPALGAEAIEVDYEPLPSLMTITEAIAAESYQGSQRTVARGDVEAGLAAAAHRFERRVRVRRPGALLPRDERGPGAGRRERPDLRPVQHPAPVRDPGHRRARARAARATRSPSSACGPAAASAARRCSRTGSPRSPRSGPMLTGRPVRLNLHRFQDITMTGKRHPFHASWEVGFDADLQLCALRCHADQRRRLEPRPVRAGARPGAVPHRQRLLDPRHLRSTAGSRKTNKTSQTAFRGFGGPQGMIVIEDILGRCAPLLGVEPDDLRRRNFYEPGQATPYGQPVRHAERLESIWSILLERSDFRRRQAEVARLQRGAPGHQARRWR